MEIDRNPVVVGITGATGAVYGIETIRALISMNIPVSAVLTEQARKVLSFETEKSWEQWTEELDGMGDLLITYPRNELHHPIASGSFRTGGMVVAPCSMGTLGRIAGGLSSNLLERAADVTLKERRPLILLTRETPLNRIHLKNMLAVTDAGGIIFPPVPAFYQKPASIDEMVRGTVSRLLDLLGIPQETAKRWDGAMD
ncbi:UbiX family flavin prenyltransferase [Spirochaeta isovalerica]|uniref:Flavin prenyltransferase UbiX n=1 Tax=Spirochaeta isovalerica TaxID=150 RepID=A0A841RBM6_9SPIO|nr:flavin prenyltransferase UbiX [Spirochaeta isovalerica]MBB6480309.1 4-hydroxy-3-polyprenylbenzoate decarboxylase [Spirochaeta isovalerica]